MSIRMSPNQREVLSAISTITGKQEYLTSTNGALNTTGGGGSGGTQYQEGATTSPGTGTLAIGRYSSSAPILTNGQLEGLQLDSSGNLKVTGSLSVGGTVDEASFTAGTSTFNPSGGVFNDSVAALTSGQQGTQRLTANRAIHTNLRNAAGTEIGTSSNPIRIDPTGTTPQPVTLTSTTITGTVAATQSGTWNITNISGTISLPTGASTAANQATEISSLATIATNTGAATPAGANIIGKVGIDQTTPGTTNRVDIADSLNNPVSAFPATFLRTTDEPHQVFYDPFDSTLDVTNRWTSTQGSSGVAASNTAGVMSMGTGTTANGYSKLTSQPSFTPTIPAWMGVSDAIALPDGAAPTANSYRYWGTGTTPGTPTATSPVTDGYGFELNTDGKLRAVVYAGGTRTVVQDLSTSGNSTQPLDANYHRYIIYIRTDKTYWYIDGITSANLVATSNFQSSQVQTLPRLFLAVGGTTPPASNTQIQCTGATAWDTGKNNVEISDGTFPWRKATIDGIGNQQVKQVASSAALTNVAGSASSVTLLAANTARIGAQISNDSSSVIYIKFGTTASTTSYTVSLAGAASAPFSYYEVPAGYVGRIDAIWASSTGNARITEES